MNRYLPITYIYAREILDSRGNPTVEAEVVLDESLRGAPDLVCGANERDTHLRGLSVPRDLPRARFADLARVEEGDRCPHCGAPLRLSRGIEVGNIFQLGDK